MASTLNVPRRGFALVIIALSSTLILGASWIIVETHNVLFTLASPEVSAVSCGIHFDPFTDTDAWVRELAQ